MTKNMNIEARYQGKKRRKPIRKEADGKFGPQPNKPNVTNKKVYYTQYKTQTKGKRHDRTVKEKPETNPPQDNTSYITGKATNGKKQKETKWR